MPEDPTPTETDPGTLRANSNPDPDPSEKSYYCEYCDESFTPPNAKAQYAGHFNQAGHPSKDELGEIGTPTRPPASEDMDILSPTEDETETAVEGMLPEDEDGDGDLDVGWREAIGVIIGILLGHTIAHEPALWGEVVVTAGGALSAGRLLGASSKTPVPPEWADSAVITYLIAGALFGTALVMLPWMDVLSVILDVFNSGSTTP